MSRALYSKPYGSVSHSLCIAYFCSIGSQVSIPLFDSARYDLIADIDGILKRVQCKTAKGVRKDGKKGCVTVRLQSDSQKHYKVSDFDCLWVMTNQLLYLIPSEFIPSEDGEYKNFSLTKAYTTFIVSIQELSGKDPVRENEPLVLTDLERIRLEELYLAREPLQSIAYVMGIPLRKVRHYIDTNIIRPRRLTEEARAKICEMYSNGHPINEIVKETTLSKTTIKDVVKEANLHQRKPRVIKPEWENEIIAMHDSGMTPKEIARHYDMANSIAISGLVHRTKVRRKRHSLHLTPDGNGDASPAQ